MKMKKTLALLCVIVLLTAIFAGCSPAENEGEPSANPDPESKFTVGFSIATLEFPYYVTMQKAFEAACEEKGWNYICIDSNNDAEKALNDCNDLILKGVNALVISSWYGDTLNEIFDTCAEKDIPVFLIDTGSANRDANFVTDIGTNSYEAGRIGGIWAAQHLQDVEGKSEINLINFLNETEQARQRADGFVAGLKEGGLTVNVLNEYLNNTREGYMSNCEDALITYEKIDLIYGTNALAGLGAFDACDAAKRTEMRIIGFDAEQEEIDKIEAGTNYIGSILQLPAEMAEATVQMIDDYLNAGKTFEKTTASDSGIYCAEGALTSADILK